MRLLVVLAALLFALPASAVDIEWVTVGDPGNACEVQPSTGPPGGCFGAVPYTYRISKYEITNAQYAEFLNAVAATDTNNLYNTSMGAGQGGITRSGSSGSYTYSPIPGREDMPVGSVSFWDALRFANWLHNGQPTGAQDGTTTEDGAYTFSGATNGGSRNAGATVFLTSEDEWYKAAYYDAASTSYFDYPAGSDVPTECVAPSRDTGNSANCYYAVDDLTDVGAYSLSGSPYGTFDQGGNVWELNENFNSGWIGLRGGSAYSDPGRLAALWRVIVPSNEDPAIGFRVAMIPELSTTTTTTTTTTPGTTTTTTLPRGWEVVLCHAVRGDVQRSVLVPSKKIQRHLDHGDFWGACPGSDRVALCHISRNGKWRTVLVATRKADRHLSHGDALGECALPWD